MLARGVDYLVALSVQLCFLLFKEVVKLSSKQSLATNLDLRKVNLEWIDVKNDAVLVAQSILEVLVIVVEAERIFKLLILSLFLVVDFGGVKIH